MSVSVSQLVGAAAKTCETNTGQSYYKTTPTYIVFALPISTVGEFFKVLVDAALQLIDFLDSQIFYFRIILHFILEQSCCPLTADATSTVPDNRKHKCENMSKVQGVQRPRHNTTQHNTM